MDRERKSTKEFLSEVAPTTMGTGLSWRTEMEREAQAARDEQARQQAIKDNEEAQRQNIKNSKVAEIDAVTKNMENEQRNFIKTPILQRTTDLGAAYSKRQLAYDCELSRLKDELKTMDNEDKAAPSNPTMGSK